ncbi:MAG: hypothetical protein HYX82_04610 [Chloroflexi bacterium]|nr:hypothetical protein [Chloroflexota bacterium]
MEKVPELPKLRTPDRDFIRLEVYGIYKTITELFGERGWQVIWRSGEVVFDELEKQLEFPKKDPLSVMKVLADYLSKAGYIPKIEFRMVGENMLQYDLYGASLLRPATLKLKAENCVLPHWSTVIMFAALKKLCNLKADTTEQPIFISEVHGRERWVLSPIKPKKKPQRRS